MMAPMIVWTTLDHRERRPHMADIPQWWMKGDWFDV
jgi:hypothetical protein